MAPLTDDQIMRYARQITIPEVGIAGQERLLAASAVIVGAGGLGSPALLYLAAAGVGRITVIDSDPVDLTNLQRQIAHATSDIGRNKAVSAAETARGINPEVEVTVCQDRLAADNALELLGGHDVVLDCTDNFATRYLINDACVLMGATLVTAAISRFYGQIMTIVPRRGPCYRCLFPEPPVAGSVPTCAQTGILGPVPGALGSLQALEAIKVLLGLDGTLEGRMLAIDTRVFDIELLEVSRDPGCPVCGDVPAITALADIPGTC
jgi:molybdopterin/thiamine biosynthesis adenylyltransferase